jgi:hypothetical protein
VASGALVAGLLAAPLVAAGAGRPSAGPHAPWTPRSSSLDGSSVLTAASGPPAVPTSSAYLGAFVAPHQSESQAQFDIRVELSDLGNFDGVIGRPLGLVHVYQNWHSPVRNSALATVAATGATPFVDWSCTSDADIVDGSQDSLITGYAQQLAQFGRPVFLRWFWEMNLTGLTRTANCLGTLGSAGYVQAFQHIVTLFRAAGATNVAFVWCPSIAGSDFAAPYYPGNSYVDWIGWDGYDRHQDPNMLNDLFLPFYAHWLPNGKPMVIGETGATSDQAAYLTTLTQHLAGVLPDVKAVLYYDSQSTQDWTIQNLPGNAGLDAFVAMGRSPYFQYPFAGS